MSMFKEIVSKSIPSLELFLKKRKNFDKFNDIFFIHLLESKIDITIINWNSYLKEPTACLVFLHYQPLINKLLNMLTSLRFFVIVFLSPKFSTFLWYFFFQFYNVVDFNVSLKAFVLNKLSYVNVLSREEDFLLFIGFENTQFVRFVWSFSVLFIVDIKRSVLMMGFFLVCSRCWSFEHLYMIF